jgi:hypothetical protein
MIVDLDQGLLAVIATGNRVTVWHFALCLALARRPRPTPSDNALLERGLQAHRLLVLLKEILERLVGELLKGAAALSGNGIDSLPRIVIELHSLAGHNWPDLSRLRSDIIQRRASASTE